MRPEGSMSVFILNYIRWLEPKPPIRVRSQYSKYTGLWYGPREVCIV